MALFQAKHGAGLKVAVGMCNDSDPKWQIRRRFHTLPLTDASLQATPYGIQTQSSQTSTTFRQLPSRTGFSRQPRAVFRHEMAD